MLQVISYTRVLRNVEIIGELPTQKDLFAETISLAWPSILEAFLLALVSMIDTIMVGSLGSYAIAAVGLTTQPKFIFLAVFLSLNVAVSAIVARRRGEGDAGSANQVLTQSLILTVLLTAVLSIMGVLFADPILHLAGSAPDTHDAAAAYFRIIMGGMIFNTVSMVINAAQRGVGNTKIAMRTNMVSNLVNVALNYLLIGGNFGFPRLEVRGAAIATVTGTVFACGMSVLSVLHPDGFICLRGAWKHFGFDKRVWHSIVNIGSSTLAEQIFLRMGFLIYAAIVARLGTDAFAAHQVGMNLLTMSFSFGDGLSVAAVALVGRSLGQGRRDLAKLYGSACQRVAVVFSILLSLFCISLGRPLFLLFTREEAVVRYAMMIMIFLSIITYLQISQVVYSGCLRAAGDVLYVAFVGLISVSFIRPFSGWLFCYPLGLGLFGAWVGLTIDQFTRFLFVFLRFRSGKWMNIKI